MRKTHNRRFDIATVQAPMQPVVGALFENLYSPLLYPLYHSCVDWILEITKDKQTSVIDIGCGPGILGEILLARSRNLRWIGVEPSKYFYTRLKKRLDQGHRPRAKVLCDSAETFDYSQYTNSIIISLGSIKHWKEPALALRNICDSSPMALWITEVNSGASQEESAAFVNATASPIRWLLKWQFAYRVVPRGIDNTTLTRWLDRAGLLQNPVELSGPFVKAVAQWV